MISYMQHNRTLIIVPLLCYTLLLIRTENQPISSAHMYSMTYELVDLLALGAYDLICCRYGILLYYSC